MTIEAQLRKYREAAVLRATPGDGPTGSNNARKRWIRRREGAGDVMRAVAEELSERGRDAQEAFAGLLSDREPLPTQRWAAFHVLEMCSLSVDVEANALRVIEDSSIDSIERASDRAWLRCWRASRGSRGDVVRELCRFPENWRSGEWSMLDLLRVTGYEPTMKLTATEVKKHLRDEPALVQEWLGYSQDQRCTPAWYIMECSPGRFEVGQVPSGEQLWFTDPVEAVAEFAVRTLDLSGRSLGNKPQQPTTGTGNMS